MCPVWRIIQHGNSYVSNVSDTMKENIKLTTHLILYCLISTPFHGFKRTMVLVLFWNEIIYSSHKDDIVAIKLKKVFYKTYCFKLCTLGWVLVKTTEQHKAQAWSFIIWKCATIENFWVLNWNFLNNYLFEHFLYQLYTFIYKSPFNNWFIHIIINSFLFPECKKKICM